MLLLRQNPMSLKPSVLMPCYFLRLITRLQFNYTSYDTFFLEVNGK
jgi:hypothetical protein